MALFKRKNKEDGQKFKSLLNTPRLDLRHSTRMIKRKSRDFPPHGRKPLDFYTVFLFMRYFPPKKDCAMRTVSIASLAYQSAFIISA